MNVKVIAVIGLLIALFPFSSTAIHEKMENVNLFDENVRRTLYVGGSGPGNYSKIQDAIDNASDRDTVFVCNGIYYENIVINKSINLIGENAKTTIIDGMEKSRTVFILASNVLVYNFTIRNGTIGIGNSRWHENLEKITIKNNIVINNIYEGISLWRCNHCIIYGNTVSNDRWGICLYGSYFNVVVNNNLMKNEENAHIYYWGKWPLFWTNRFLRNYWDNWRIPIPKPIVAFFYPLYPLIQFDWMPRMMPYGGEKNG